MKSTKKPYDIFLQALRRDYTYDPLTGEIRRHGKLMGRPKAAYLSIGVVVNDPEHLSATCSLQAHCIAWYLTYGEWATQEIDHIDGDGRNNRLSNLRLATRLQQCWNKGKISTKPTSSQYVGVHRDKDMRSKPWEAYITYEGKRRYLGYFATEEEAARAYDTAARQLFGRYARLNFPDVVD